MAIPSLLVLATASYAQAIFEARVVTVANTTVIPSGSATTNVGSTTIAPNVTSSFGFTTSSASITSSDTCCYIVNYAIGVNSWYTNTANITVATAITKWIQYDDTVVVDEVTTVYDPSATAIFGKYDQGSIGENNAYTTIPFETILSTESGWVPFSSGADSGSFRPTTTYLTTLEDVVLYTSVSVPSGIPTTLLHQSGAVFVQYYQQQWIGTETAMTFTEQDLTMLTSTACQRLTTKTNWEGYVTATVSGTPTLVHTTVPTRTYLPGPPLPAQIPYDVTIIAKVVQPFPSGVYTNWTYDAFIAENGQGVESFGENVFNLPEGLPGYLAGFPAVVSSFPDIGSCTNGIGHGEPTIHVPVNALTTESHTTQTVSGNYNKAATTTANLAATTTPVDGPSSTVQATGPVGEPTTAAADQQGTSAGAGTSPAAGSNASGQGTTTAAGVRPGPAAGTNAGQPGSPSSASNENSPANAPTTAAQPATPNAASQGRPVGATTSAVAFTYVPLGTTAPAAVTFGTNVATQNSASDFVVGSTTIAAGGPAATIGGTTVSVASGGSAVVVNGQTSAVVAPSSTPALVVGGTTLVAGGAAVTVGGTTVALASGGSAVVVNGKTSPLAAGTGAALGVGTTAVATPNASGGYILPGGQTLSSGGLLVESGTIYAVGPSGALIVNGQTATPLPGSGQSGDGVASAIMSMFGIGGTGQSSATAGSGAASGSSTPTGTVPAPYTGGAAVLNTMTQATALGVAALLVLVSCL
ncbi:hypothetical protein LTR95_014541 [Oleoguttula sp. CCFEE 5521]